MLPHHHQHGHHHAGVVASTTSSTLAGSSGGSKSINNAHHHASNFRRAGAGMLNPMDLSGAYEINSMGLQKKGAPGANGIYQLAIKSAAATVDNINPHRIDHNSL